MYNESRIDMIYGDVADFAEASRHRAVKYALTKTKRPQSTANYIRKYLSPF